MPEVRLTGRFRVQNGIEVPTADPSKRLRGEFVEVSEEELAALKAELGDGGLFSDLSEENLEVRREEEHEPSEKEPEPGEEKALEDVVSETKADNLREAGFETLPDARGATDEELDAVEGIGDVTISDIRDA